MSSQIAFLGVDTETTGLDPVNDHLLEIAVVAFDKNLRPLSAMGGLIVTTENYDIIVNRGVGTMPEFVQEMHDKSGLWDALEAESLRTGVWNLANIDKGLCNVLEEWYVTYGRPEKKLPILGNSSHFDRRFMEARLPNLLAKFSHRHIDPSGLMELLRAADPVQAEILDAQFPDSIEHQQFQRYIDTDAEHRAEFDIHRSAAQVRYILRNAELRTLFPLYTYDNQES